MKKVLILISIVFLCIYCDPRKEDPRAKLVDITLTIKDDAGNLVTDAKIYLLGSISDFENSYASFKGTNAIDSTSSNNGLASITIEGNKKYYLFITYKDPARKLILTNEGYSNTINELPKNLNVKVDIKLIPSSANISVWSTDVNQFPIEVKINKEVFTISKPLVSAPKSVNDNDIFVKSVRQGSYSIAATNATGCTWTEQIVVKKGEFKTTQLGQCELQDVLFYCSESNSLLFPIKLIVNDNELLGNLNTSKQNFACGDDEANTLKFKKEKGIFTYVAYANENKCAWTGTFKVDGNQCTVVKLEDCK